MAVVTDFEANPVDSNLGLVPPIQAVQFKDTSTGSPDSWLWDFGDGNFSDAQHPLHTYEGTVSQTFTVKLISWINDSIVTQSGTLTEQTRSTGAEADEPAAWAAWLLLGWSGNTPTVSALMNFEFGGGSVSYTASRNTTTHTLAVLGVLDVAFVAELQFKNFDAVLNRTIGSAAGSVEISVDGSPISTQAGQISSSWFPVGNLKPFEDSTISYRHAPVEASIGTPIPVTNKGFIAESRINLYKVSSADNKDEEEKVDFVIFGAPPVANFDADPKNVSDGGTIDFINNTTEAIGLPTTYSWKRRRTGSGDSFVEFSTEKNPSIGFGK